LQRLEAKAAELGNERCPRRHRGSRAGTGRCGSEALPSNLS
jgi:hypothetical protein